MGVGAEGYEVGVGRAVDPEAIDGVDAVDEAVPGVEDSFDDAEVALFAEVVEDGPGGCDAAAGAGAGVAAGGVEARGPVFEGEALVFDEGLVAEEEAGDALVGVAELVDVHGNGGDAIDGEVVVGDGVAELSGEGEYIAAVTGVDVAPEVVLLGEGADFGDGVGDAVGVGGSGAGDEDGVFVDGAGHGVEVGVEVRAGRDPDGLDAEDVGGLVEGGVGGVGDDDLGAVAPGLWSRAQALAALTATTMLSVPPEVRLPPAPSGAESISRRASRSSRSYLTRLGKRSGAKRALWLMYIW